MPPSPSDTLKQGVLIETGSLLLPWGASKAALRKQCRPDQVDRSNGWDVLIWEGPVILSGLRCLSLEADFCTNAPLEQVEAWLACGYSSDSAEAAFRGAYQHLKKLFGNPRPPVPKLDDPPYEQSTCWELDGAAISLILKLGPEFGDYSYGCLLVIEGKKKEHG